MRKDKRNKKTNNKKANLKIVTNVTQNGTQEIKKTSLTLIKDNFYLNLNEKSVVIPVIKKTDDKQEIFISKMKQCSDFNIDDNQTSYREGETTEIRILRQIIDFTETNDTVYNDIVYSTALKMFKIHIFRVLPPASNPHDTEDDSDDSDDEGDMISQHIPLRIHLYYRFFLNFIESPNFQPIFAKDFINEKFISSLLTLFDSEYHQERHLLYCILHRIYGLFLGYRPFIRKQINNIFHEFIYESRHHNGISNILELLEGIIAGFLLPLKNEHKVFLTQILLPLYSLKKLNAYSQDLTHCVIQFLKKDSSLTKTIILGILKYWFKSNVNKKISLMIELEKILEIVTEQEFKNILKPLFTHFAAVIRIEQRVALQVLESLRNKYIIQHIVDNSEEIIPIMFPALFCKRKKCEKHIPELVFEALQLYSRINKVLFDECVKTFDIQCRNKLLKEEERRIKRDSLWNNIEKLAQLNPLYPSVMNIEKKSIEDLTNKLSKLELDIQITHDDSL